MTVEAALVEYLLTQTPVTTLVSTRIYQLMLPQRATLPAVKIQLIDDIEPKHLRGPGTTLEARVQIDAFDTDASGVNIYDRVSAIAEAVNESLVFEPFTVDGSVRILNARRIDRTPMRESEELRQVRMMLQYYVSYRTMN